MAELMKIQTNNFALTLTSVAMFYIILVCVELLFD